VLVTGAGGYIGQTVIAALDVAGHDPVALVHSSGPAVSAAKSVQVTDILDEYALRRAVDGIDVVCHLAGLTRARESLTDPLRYFRVNTGGTVALLEAMAAAEVRGLVFASTGSIYGTPDQQPMREDFPDAPPHPYACSKLAAEFAVEAQARRGGIGAVVLRLLNVAGGVDPDPTRLIPRAITAAAENSVLEVNGDGTVVRDYLHVADAADAFVAAIEHLPPPGNAVRYNIGSGRGTSILDVVAAAERVTGRRISLVHKPSIPEPTQLISDSRKAVTEISWSPKHSDIDAIIQDAWRAAGSLT